MKNKYQIHRSLSGRSSQWLGLFTITFSLLAATPAAHADSATWSATPADALWSNTANWSISPVPGVGDTATFGTSNTTTIDTGDISLTQIATTTTTGYTFGTSVGTGSITFGDGPTTALNIIVTPGPNVTANITINANIILGTAVASNTTFTSGTNKTTTLAGSITGGTGGTPAAKLLTLAPTSNSGSLITISGAISDGGAASLALYKGGTGTVSLTNASNSFTGGLTVLSGTVNVSSLGALGSATTGLIILGTGNQSAGILNFTGSPGSLSRQVQIGGGAAAGTGGATINNNATNGSSPLIFTNPTFNAQSNNGAGGPRVLTLGGSNTDANEIQGVIRNNTGSGAAVAVTKAGAGTWTLAGANTYTGGTVVNQGTLTVGTAGTLGAATGALAVNNTNTGAGTDAVLNLSTDADTTVGSLSGTIATPTTGTNTATITTQATRNFTVNQTAAGSYAGVIAGTGSFTLGSLSTNTLTLSGANTYTGATTVTNGTLVINGDSSVATGAVTVNGGTLGGMGSIGGAVTVAADGSLAPGNAGVGTLSLKSNLDISAQAGITGTGKLNFDIGSIASSDKIAIDGILTIGTEVLGFSDFNFSTLAGLENGTYTLITSGGITGSLDPDSADLTGTVGDRIGTLQLSGSGNNIELVVSSSVSDPYVTWAGSGVNFDDDANNDGVDNGLAWLLGAPDKNANATGLLPKSEKVAGGLKLTFQMLPAAERDGAKLYLEYSTSLASWSAGELVPDAGELVTPVTFVISGINPLDVEATISDDEAAAGKLFGRLRAER